MAFKTEHSTPSKTKKKNYVVCLLDYVCLALVCGREEAQETKDNSFLTCWQL